MLLLGLTGSIATGKSTVSNILRSPPYNLPIIDADVIARRVVEPGTAGYKSILSHFAATTPDLLLEEFNDQFPDTGKGKWLNRPALGKRVFGDSPERAKDRRVLNGIVHPAVRWEMYRQLLRCYFTGCWAVVLDVPLLFESGLDLLCGTVLVVGVTDPEIQMQRLMSRDSHLSREDAEGRVKSQGDIREKATRCEARGKGWGVVIWNDAGKDELRADLDKVMKDIKDNSPVWWAWMLLLCPPLAAMVAFYSWYESGVATEKWDEKKLREKAKL